MASSTTRDDIGRGELETAVSDWTGPREDRRRFEGESCGILIFLIREGTGRLPLAGNRRALPLPPPAACCIRVKPRNPPVTYTVSRPMIHARQARPMSGDGRDGNAGTETGSRPTPDADRSRGDDEGPTTAIDDGDGSTSRDDLLDHLAELEKLVDSIEERRKVRTALRAAEDLPGPGVFGEHIQKYTTRDMAEAFVGAIIFSVPLLVEDGIFDIADHFLTTTIAGVPVYFAANIAFIVLMAYGLLYWADIQRVQITRPILGIIPRRLLGVLLISLLTAGTMMTLWGRVDWANPIEAIARISVIWTMSTFGGAIGDILPGESAGADVNDLFDDMVD